MHGDKEAALNFLTGITDAADFDQLGDDAFDTYIRILALYRERGDVQKNSTGKN